MQSRRIVVSLAAVAVAAAAVVPSASASTSPTPARSAASAATTYAVRSTTLTFVDTSRPTAPNGTYPGARSRTLPTLVLYPVRHTPGQRFPLVVFSHGFTASGPLYAPLLQKFAAAGYVVAAPTFPLTNYAAPGGPKLADYVNQPKDVSFVITKLLQRDRAAQGPLAKLIDREHIAATGHSLGAITTLGLTYNSCCVDKRIDAAVSMSGAELQFPNGDYTNPPATPLLLLHGNDDGTVPYVTSLVAYLRARAPKYFVTLEGAPHIPFGAPWETVVVRSTIDFLNAYVAHRPGSLARLTVDANVKGVASMISQA